MVRTIFLGLVLLALTACSGGAGRLRTDVPSGVNLSGTWHLDREASDDPQAMVDRMRQDFMKRMMRRRAYGTPDDDDPLSGDESAGERRNAPNGGPSADGRGPGDGGVRARFMQRFPYAVALGSVLNSDSLKIEQSPTRFVLIRGEDRRTFTPGEASVVSVADGVADQHSGWSGREYVIEVRPQVGAHVIARYGLSADGHRLVEKFSLTDEGLPKLEFTRVYEPGPHSERGLPTSN